MDKRVKSVPFEGQHIQPKEVVFRSPERGLVVLDTQKRDYYIWVFDTSGKEKDFFLCNQREALKAMAAIKGVIRLLGETVIDEKTVCLITERVERESLAIGSWSKNMIDHNILTLGIQACEVMMALHEAHKLANFLNPDYIFQDKEGEYKFTNFTLCFDREQTEINNKDILSSKLFSENRSVKGVSFPENLNSADDVFCLGLLLHLLCFGTTELTRDPKDVSKLILLDTPKHAFCILNAIEGCLHPKQEERPKLADLLDSFKNEQRLDLPEHTKSNDSTIMANIDMKELVKREKTPLGSSLRPGILSSLSKIYSLATTETEGWFRSYVEEDVTAPDDDYLNRILEKLWRKREKVTKLFEIVEKFVDDSNINRRSVVVAKILLFLHGIMFKGPSEVFTTPLCERIKKTKKSPLTSNSVSFLHYLLSRIRVEWEPIAKSNLKDNKDILRTQAFSYLVYFYALVLSDKAKFGLDYVATFAGNFSIEPMQQTQNIRAIFGQKAHTDIHSYCSMFLRFFKLLPDDIGMKAIQFSICRYVASEINCLLGIYAHFVKTFKSLVNSFAILEKALAEKYVESLETNLDNCILRFHYSLEDLRNSPVFKVYSEFLPYSTLSAINEIRNTQKVTTAVDVFNIEEHFPAGANVGCFTVPTPYGHYLVSKCVSEQEKILIIRRELVALKKAETERNPRGSAKAEHNEEPRVIVTKSLKDVLIGTEDPLQSRRKKITIQPIFSDTYGGGSSSKHPYVKLENDQEIDVLDIKTQLKKPESSVIKEKARSHTPDSLVLSPDQRKVKQGEDNPLNNSFNSKEDQVQSPLLDNDDSAFDAKDAMNTQFMRLIPVQPQMEDKEIQCDMNGVAEQQNQNQPFNLHKFMKDEIANDIQDWIIKYSDLQFGREIANGSTCTVIQGEYRGLPVAIKKLKIDVDMKFMKEFKRELAIMLRIRPHPNLVSFIGVCNEDGHLILVTEYCQGGTLFGLLHKNRGIPLSMKQKKKIMVDVTRGMIFLHENNTPVIHRDMKSLNLLFDAPIDNDQTMNFNVKIADFGLAKVVDPKNYEMTSYMGTFHWMAPEILNNEAYTLKADVYSFAVVMWEILARQTPFSDLKNPHAIVKYVAVNKGRPKISDMSSTTNAELMALMQRCWDENPDVRPTFTEILSILNKIEV